MLRRAALLVCLAAPFGTAAQTAGDMTFYIDGGVTTAIGQSACSTTPALSMQWNIQFASGTTAIPTDATYKITASSSATTTDCTASNAFVVNDSIPAISSTQSYPTSSDPTLSPDALVSGVQLSCSQTTDATIYVCVRLYCPSSATTCTPGNVIGSATGTLALQLQAPAAPTGISVTSGDSRLYVSWTASAGTPEATSYRAVATSTVDTSFSRSCTTSQTSCTITGLENGVTYSVVVYATSSGGNEGPASDPAVMGTPEPVKDFWAVYHDAGGREQGGCGMGGAGALAFLGAAAALLLRRRR